MRDLSIVWARLGIGPHVSRTRMLVLVLVVAMVVPGLLAACGLPPWHHERVGSSQSAAVTSASVFHQVDTTDQLEFAWNTTTAAGQVSAQGGGSNGHQLTLLEGNFDGGPLNPNIVGAAYVGRNFNGSMGGIAPISTASGSWGHLTTYLDAATTTYSGPVDVAYLHVTGQWIAAAAATPGGGNVDLALAVTPDGGSTWPVVESFFSLIGETQATFPFAYVNIAVDYEWTNRTAAAYTNAYGKTNAAGNYYTTYVLGVTESGPPSLIENGYLFAFFVDSNNQIFNLGKVGGNNCLLGNLSTDGLSCYEGSGLYQTMNLAVGHPEAGCTSSGSTYLWAAWAGTNPFNLSNGGCKTDYTQVWHADVLFKPDPTFATNAWFYDWVWAQDPNGKTRTCIGDQINWPRVALANDHIDGTMVMAISEYCTLCPYNGQMIGYLQTNPIGCPPEGGGGYGAPITGSNSPSHVCLNTRTLAPCYCGSSGCGTTPPAIEEDQILPGIAYDGNNNLSLTWYDNVGRDPDAGATCLSCFGSNLARASAGTGSDKISNLQADFYTLIPLPTFAPPQENDAAAVVNKRMGLSPWNGPVDFMGAANSLDRVYNMQWISQ